MCTATENHRLAPRLPMINPKVISFSYPLLNLQISTLYKLRQALDHQLCNFLSCFLLPSLLLLLQDGCIELHHVLHVNSLDVAWQGCNFGPQHCFQGLVCLLKVSVRVEHTDERQAKIKSSRQCLIHKGIWMTALCFNRSDALTPNYLLTTKWKMHKKGTGLLQTES